MKNIISLLLSILVSLPASANSVNDLHPAYTRLILDGQRDDIITAARVLSVPSNYNPELAELCALALWKISRDEKILSQTDEWVLIRLIRVLEQDTTGRYKQLLIYSQARAYEYNEVSPDAEYSKAVEKIKNTDSVQFEVTPDFLKEMRKKIENVFSSSKSIRDASSFYKVLAGEHFKETLPSFGLPDQIRGLPSRRGNARRHGSVKMELTYNNLIRIGLVNELNTETGWYVYDVDYLSDRLQPNPLDRLSTTEKIQTAHATLLREMAKDLFNNKVYDTHVLDAAMARVFKESKTRDTQLEDAVAWLCKLVGYSKNKSYMPELLRLKSTTTNRKLKRYAIKSYQLLRDSDPEDDF